MNTSITQSTSSADATQADQNKSPFVTCRWKLTLRALLERVQAVWPDSRVAVARSIVFGLAVFVVAQTAAPSAAPASAQKSAIAVLDFELNDLTLTPGIPEEQERTASIGPLLRQFLESRYDFDVVEIDSGTQNAADKAFGYLFDHHDVAADLGREAESDWIVVGRVHKASFLFVYLKVHVIDTKARRLIADLTVEVKGPQRRLTIKGVETLAEQIAAAIDSNG